MINCLIIYSLLSQLKCILEAMIDLLIH